MRLSPQERSIKIDKRKARLYRYEQEVEAIKKLKLPKSPENKYNHQIRARVPRPRLIGHDGVVRANRTTNQEPTKMPKDSTYMKMTGAFNKLRRAGIEAKWNIMVPEADTFIGYFCSLPEVPELAEAKRITHWKAAGITNDPMSTGILWTYDWEPVQDAVSFECFGGTEEIFQETLAEYGIQSRIYGKYDYHVTVRVVFRGDGAVCKASWRWEDYAMSLNKVEAPPIGSVVTDVTPFLEMFYEGS